jgi:hypothetical protein
LSISSDITCNLGLFLRIVGFGKTLFYRIIGHQRRKLTRFIDELYVGSQAHNTEDKILEGWQSHYEQLAERSISENYDKGLTPN